MTPPEIEYSLQGLTLSVRSQNGYTIAAIGGDLDIASVPALREQLLDCWDLMPAVWSSIYPG